MNDIINTPELDIDRSTSIGVPRVNEEKEESSSPLKESNRLNASTKHAKTQRPGKMSISLVFKKTCYKCGNLGHHADDCEFDERLCYNCKKPGHESSKCPEGKKTDIKQCYYCKEVGHIQADCKNYKHTARESNKDKTNTNIQKKQDSNTNSNNSSHRKNQRNRYTPDNSPYQNHIPVYPAPILAEGHIYHPHPLISQVQYLPNTLPYQQIHPGIQAIYPGYPPMQYSLQQYRPHSSSPSLPMVNQQYALELMQLRTRSHEDLSGNYWKKKIRCYTCGGAGHDSKHCHLKYKVSQ